MHGAVNRAIAVAEGDGAEAGLALADRLDLDGYQHSTSARADLLSPPRPSRGGGRNTNARSSLRTPSRSAASSRGASHESAPTHRSAPESVPVREPRSWSSRHESGREPRTEERDAEKSGVRGAVGERSGKGARLLHECHGPREAG